MFALSTISLLSPVKDKIISKFLIATISPRNNPFSCRQRHFNTSTTHSRYMSAAIDFAALRRERETREAAKRKRDSSISPPPSRKAPKLEASPAVSTSTVTLPSGARLSTITSNTSTSGTKIKPIEISDEPMAATGSITTSQTVEKTKQSGGLQYPDGIIKKTWAFGHERDGHDVKIEEVLEHSTLRTAVLSAFEWDLNWVLTKLKTPLDGGNTNCVFIMQAKGDEERAQKRQVFQGHSWVRLCFPPMEGQTNCMHSKLMLLFHPTKLRIAIPSANLRNFDWGETGVMENSVFMIDLPRLPDDKKVQRDSLTDFGKELLFFLDKQGLDRDVKDGLLNFDFSSTGHIAFVQSVGGISTGDDAQHSGVASLSRAVNQLQLASNDVQIDFAASSIGSLKDAQLSLLHAAASGANVFNHTGAAASQKAATFFQRGRSNQDHGIRDMIRIYFPTKETVQASTAKATGTICLSRPWFEDMSFPRRCFRDYISTRPGLLSHNKIMYVQGTSPESGRTAWVYMGSANVSESAWGKVVMNKKTKTGHVNCRNWECGVVLAVKDVPAIAGTADLSIFDSIVRPPFLYPGPEYNGREPWYFKEHMQ